LRPKITMHANVGVLVLVQFARVDVDVNDSPVLGELRELAGHAIVEAHANASNKSASLMA